MATVSFDSWFHGGPLALNIGATKDFSYWFHGCLVLRPDITQVTNNKSFTMQARIVQPTGRTIQARARILVNNTRTISMRGFIKTPRPISMKGRVARHQGWPILNVVDPGFPLFQPTQLSMRGRITQGSPGSQSLDMRAKIIKGGTVLLQARGRIVKAGYLSMRAKIKPRFSSSKAAMIFRVANAQQSTALMLFYTQGSVGQQSMTMKARIAPVYRTAVTGFFTINRDPGSSKVIAIGFESDTGARQVLSMKARIAIP